MSDERAVTWLPLSRAAFCLNEEAVFDLAERACPVCGSQTFVLLARWLQERTGVDEQRDHSRPDVEAVHRGTAAARPERPRCPALRVLPSGA